MVKSLLILRPFAPSYDEVVTCLKACAGLEVVECSSLEELAAQVRRLGACVVLAHCQEESHASEFLDFFETCQSEIRVHLVRVMVTTAGADFATLQPKFVREGACEVLAQPIHTRTLAAKIERFVDQLPARGPQIRWSAPLKLQSDCWSLIEGKIRWIPGACKWSVTLIGPPPQYGEWSACDTAAEAEREESIWEWIPNGLNDDPFILEDGAWKFRGEKPEFKDGAWQFVGNFPMLAFVRAFNHKGEVLGVRFEGNTQFLTAATDSDRASAASELIEKALREHARVASEIKTSDRASTHAQPLPPASSEGSVPEYLRRVRAPEKKCEVVAKTGTFSLLAVAYLASELQKNRALSLPEVLTEYCRGIANACEGKAVEFWFSRESDWKCVQHDDLMDMALEQRLKVAGNQVAVIRASESCAVLLVHEGERLGALVFSRLAAERFTETEILGVAEALLGILVEFRQMERLSAVA